MWATLLLLICNMHGMQFFSSLYLPRPLPRHLSRPLSRPLSRRLAVAPFRPTISRCVQVDNEKTRPKIWSAPAKKKLSNCRAAKLARGVKDRKYSHSLAAAVAALLPTVLTFPEPEMP